MRIIYNIDSSETYNSGKRKHTRTFHAIHSAVSWGIGVRGASTKYLTLDDSTIIKDRFLKKKRGTKQCGLQHQQLGGHMCQVQAPLCEKNQF